MLRYLFITVTAWMWLATGACAQDVISGSAFTEHKGGADFHYVLKGKDKYMIGCSPGSELSQEMQDRLYDCFSEDITVTGEVTEDNLFGMCIQHPQITACSKPKEEEKTVCDLSGYKEISFSEPLSGTDKCMIQAMLEGIFWEPAYQVSVNSLQGLYRYFIERNFKLVISPIKEKGIVVGANFVFKEKGGEFGVLLPFVSIAGTQQRHPEILQELHRQKRFAPDTFSLLLFNSAGTTQEYSRDQWVKLDVHDWMVFLKPAIENGYIEEAE
jgi:hypothetical protein